ncbi:DUF642 domain-containing protein [Herbaspirillum lusitanum]|jgi:hypothetical protein|uniref:DUF642 domain-containing protein n=1 Tax=Herbaspirillum lusitanum TaxID=213312 RepID=A0ABW9A5C8_9BURK
MKKLLGILAIAFLGFNAGAASAATVNLVTNGGFETTTNGGGKFSTVNGTTVATGWTSTGYTYIYTATGGDTNNYLQLWGPKNGSANGLTASPTGGNYIGSDGVWQAGPLSQTINNLIIGQTYVLSFDWAGAQQNGFTGATTEAWQVSLGDETYTTQYLSNLSHGFTGWTSSTFTFTATAVSEVLSFLAKDTPSGVPPFSLLDNVSLVAAVPEPGTLSVMLLGALALFGVAMARRRTASKL